MSDQIRQMLERAAKVSPQYQQFTCYTQVLKENGRRKARSYNYSQIAQGTLRWPDYDDRERFYGGAVGEGLVTLIGSTDPVPDLVQAGDGTWLSVQSAEGKNAMGTNLKLIVKRWTGDPPNIEDDGP